MIKFPNTLSFRLTCWYAGSFSLFLILALVLFYFSLGKILENRMDEDLQEDLVEFREIYRADGLPGILQEIERETGQGNSEHVFIQVIDSNMRSVHQSDVIFWPGLKVNLGAIQAMRKSAAEYSIETQSLEDWEHPARIAYGVLPDQLILQIGESLEDTNDLLELILMIFAFMMFLVIPVAAYIGWRISRKAVHAITDVSNAASDIRAGQFDRQIDTQAYGEEIETLVETFNTMAKKIQKLMSEMREMTDNIAHDLRSPIARIRVISETLLANSDNSEKVESAVSDTIIECDKLIKLINTTLDVAEAEADVVTASAERIDLSEMAEEMCELYQPLAEQKCIRLRCTIQPGCEILGRRENLQRLFVNLIDNALKYTPAQGDIAIQLSHDTGTIDLVIADSGIGISEQDKPYVFDRFYRCDESRTEEGCGLGLSFVAAVVKAHGGQIKLDSQLGQGTSVTVSFTT